MKIILPIAAALLLTTAAGAQTPGKEGVAAARTTNGVANWTTYNADLKGSRYSPLDQINPGNFKDLKSPGGSKPTFWAAARNTSWNRPRWQ